MGKKSSNLNYKAIKKTSSQVIQCKSTKVTQTADSQVLIKMNSSKQLMKK
jgi:hypothetical protein